MNSDSSTTSTADRSALSLIGSLLAAATLFVAVSAAVAVSGYHEAQAVTLSAAIK